MLPHLQRAVRLTIRLENAGIDHQAALEGLDRAHSATIVVDGHGAILFATRLAEAMLRRGDGVRAANGRLTCAGRAASDRLHRLIANAVGSPSLKPVAQCGGVAIEREDGRPPLTLLVAPFRPGVVSPGVVYERLQPMRPAGRRSRPKGLIGWLVIVDLR